ncbi:MAG: GNAT family N-acetyltransferase [Candidatus Poribacteria bacterium]|nr:GNAT family N-acetyltransferase [Candidatus Poribacteria bacterium]MDE0424551.1 GNAT family N-acetyltransferase [Candidatus Poribacteria bacterium]
MIEIRSHPHASELISLSGIYLEQNECENNLPIGLAYRLAEDPYYYTSELPVLLSILEQGQVVGVAVMTPPKRIILSRIDTDIQAAAIHLVRHLRKINIQIPGVVGPATEAQAFADGWIEGRSGVSVRLSKRMRVFEARTVADLPLSPGQMRFARPDDDPLMARWIVGLSEAIGEPVSLESAKSRTEKLITDQQLYVWDNEGPVSIAGVSRPMRNGTTIGLVYTPPEHRGKGYATSCVLLLTKKLLSDGYSFCSLYTDLSNPTSNSIYTKIGYVPIGDALELDFLPI